MRFVLAPIVMAFGFLITTVWLNSDIRDRDTHPRTKSAECDVVWENKEAAVLLCNKTENPR